MPRAARTTFIAVLLCCGSALSESLPLSEMAMDRWTQEEGLPTNWVLDVARTKDGYLWLATFDGVVRFDGVRFVPLSQLVPGLGPDVYTRRVHAEPDGSLVLVEERRVRRVLADKLTSTTESHAKSDLVAVLPAQGEDAYWATQAGRIVYLSADGGSVPQLPDGSALGDATAVSRLAGSGLVFTRKGELVRVAGSSVTRTPVTTAGCDGAPQGIRTLSGGRLALILGGDGVCVVTDGGQTSFGPANGLQGAVNDVYEDSAGRVWLLTTRGLQRIEDGRVVRDAPAFEAEVNAALEDDEGSFWVGSSEGLVRFRTAVFSAFPFGQKSAQPVSILARPDGDVLFGTMDGALFEWKDGRVSQRIAPLGPSGDWVQSLIALPDGSVAMTVLNHGLYRVKGAELEPLMDEAEYRKRRFRDQLLGPGGHLWLCGRAGLFEVVDGQSREIGTALGLEPPIYLRGDGRGAVWGIDAKGLVHVLRDRAIRVEGPTGGGPPYSVTTDHRGRVWMATLHGLLLFEDDEFVGALDAVSGGLPPGELHGATSDGQANLWLSGNQGATLLSADDAAASVRAGRPVARRTFTTADGLPVREFVGGNPHLSFDAAGRVWGTTLKGPVRGDPRRLGTNRLAPPVYIEALRVDGRPIPIDGIPELEPGGQQYAFDYTALSMLVPSRVRFQYRLDGYDREWVEAGDRRTAYYTALAPGLHRFRVKASNNDGVWNEAGATLDFKLKPAFHQTGWFSALCGVLAAGALFSAHRLRLRQLTARQAALEATVAERTRDLAAEKERSERLLLNVLPAPIADRLKQSEESIADHFDAVTILFADIVGFTELSTRLTPAELVNVLNEIFSTFDALAESHGVEKIKTIGDAYMAVAGVPAARADHAEVMVRLALAMSAALAALNERRGMQLRVRVGINTGPVVAGVIGRRKFSYDLWGDAVNVASRMESHGVAGRIQISRSTFEQVKDRFPLEARGHISVKGKGELETWLVAG